MALALYRKYRPRTFAEVIGQEHVTEPLSQALRSGRLHHAYLFSGPRGCGKTSSARILARSLNCEQGPTPEPCGVCASCRSLANDGAGSIDVIEIDAASHGGVDDARDLREKAFFAPAGSRYKIYVIDEAHMVSSAGFNALLKLVEEPPEYVKFIFATTEPEKVLGTIRSRTHHYPFRLIPPATLRPYLQQLAEAEGIPIEPAVFPLVVRAGGGSARDSLSVLDQLIAGAGPDGVSYARAVALLGVTDVTLLDDMCDALAAGDGASAFATIDRVAEAGHDPRRFASDLLERFRDLIVMQQVPDAVTKGLIDGPADQLDVMAAQATRLGPATLSRCADIVHNGLVDMRGTTAPRLLLELIMARMLLPGADDSSGALLQRLERMERRLTLGADSVRGELPPPPATEAGVAVPPVGEPAGSGGIASSGGGLSAARAAAAAAAGRRGPAAGSGARAAQPASAPAAASAAPDAARGEETSADGSEQGEQADRGAVDQAPSGGSDAAGQGRSGAAGPDRQAASADAGQPAVSAQAAVSAGAGPSAEPDYDAEPPWDDEPEPDFEHAEPAPRAEGAGPADLSARRDALPGSEAPEPGEVAGRGSGPSVPPQATRRAEPAGVLPDAPEESGAAAVNAGVPGALDVTAVREVWPEIVTALGRQSKKVAALASGATVRDLDGDTVVLTFRFPAHARMVAPEASVISNALYEALGGRWQVRCEVAGDGGATAPTSGGPSRGSASGNGGGPTRNGSGGGPAAPRAQATPAGAQQAVRASERAPQSRRRTEDVPPPSDDDWPEPARPGGPSAPSAPVAAPADQPADEEDGWPEVRPVGGAAADSGSAPPDSARSHGPGSVTGSASRAADGGFAGQAADGGLAGGAADGGIAGQTANGGLAGGGVHGGFAGHAGDGRVAGGATDGGVAGRAAGGGFAGGAGIGAAGRAQGSDGSARAGMAGDGTTGLDGSESPTPGGEGEPSASAVGDASTGVAFGHGSGPGAGAPGQGSAQSGTAAGPTATGTESGDGGADQAGPSPEGGGLRSGAIGSSGGGADFGAAVTGDLAAGSAGSGMADATGQGAGGGASQGVAGQNVAPQAAAGQGAAGQGVAGQGVAGQGAGQAAAGSGVGGSAGAMAAARAAAKAAGGGGQRAGAGDGAGSTGAGSARTGNGRNGGPGSGLAAARAAAAAAANARGAGGRAGGGANAAWSDGSPTEEAPYDPEFDGPSLEGFAPGDEPLDDVIDEKTARESSEQQAMRLLQEAFGAEKIGES